MKDGTGNKLSRPSLSHPEREFYIQVKNTLVRKNFKFRRVVLNNFVHWIFINFPNVKLHSVHSDAFWDSVGTKLTVTQLGGDLSVAKFFPLFQLIIKALEGISPRQMLGKAWDPQLKPCTPCPSPCVR